MEESGQLILGQIWKTGHATFSVLDGRGNLRRSQARAQGDESRHRGWRASHFFAVADATLAHIDGARAVFSGVRGQGTGPGHFIRIDVDDVGLYVNGGAAPFGSTIQTGKNHSVFSDAEGDELSFVAESFESFESPLMRFERPHGQQIFGEKLARE